MRALLLLVLVGCPSNPDTDTGNDTSGDTDVGDTDTDDTAVDTGELPEGCAGRSNADDVSGKVCAAAAACQLAGEQAREFYGWSVASGGDVDGDGVHDLVIGAPTHDASTVPDVGRAAILGGALLSTDGPPELGVLYGVGEDEYVGHDVVIVPDVDGDGLDDVLVSAVGNAPSGEAAGQVYLVLGKAGGWGGGAIAATSRWDGEVVGGRAGWRVFGPGDLDGDGVGELITMGEAQVVVGEESRNGPGRVYLQYGHPDAWPATGSLGDWDATFEGDSTVGMAGSGLATGDFDGDGTLDLAIGAPYDAGYYARVHVYPGGTRFSGAADLHDSPWQLDGEVRYDTFGYHLAAGDLDGDGAAELIVGAPLADEGLPESGTVYVYPGGPDFHTAPPDPIAKIYGEFDDQQLGSGLVVGDHDGDGKMDLLAGAIQAYEGRTPKAGKTYLFHGGDWPAAWATGISAGQAADATVLGEGANDRVGKANAMGDLNGDGKLDLLVASGDRDIGAPDLGVVYLFWSE